MNIWLHPRISNRDAVALAARLGCRLVWKDRGVVLQPQDHAQAC